MRRSVLPVVFLVVACHRELPTEPLRESRVATNAVEPPMVRISPDPVTVAAGQQVSATAYLTQDAFTYPSAVPISSGDSSVASVTGAIPAGQKSANVTVLGIAEGETNLDYTLFNFGRAPGGGTAARVMVTAPTAPEPPGLRMTMSPNPVELRTGQELEVFVKLTARSETDVTFTAETRNVVDISGRIAAGKLTGTLLVRAIGTGNTNLIFHAREHTGIAGRALVQDPPPPPRRRSARS
jgi:hypothetical protein